MDMATGHRFLAHTADEGVELWGDTLKGLFVEAATVMFDLICDLDTVCEREERRLRVEAESPGDLLHDWLSELLYVHEAEKMLFRDFDVHLEGCVLQGVARGERMDPVRHRLKTQVKAVTYHSFELKRAGDGWCARIVFDV